MKELNGLCDKIDELSGATMKLSKLILSLMLALIGKGILTEEEIDNASEEAEDLLKK